MKLTHSLTILALALALVGCTPSAPAPGQPPASTGPRVTVTELPGGTPVANALVWVAGAQNMGRTDEHGRAQLTAPLPPGEQTLMVSPSDRAAYQESQYRITVPAGAPEEYRLVVSPDRPLTFDHGQEVPTPAFSPAPQRVSPDKILWTNSDPDRPVIGTYLLNAGAKWNATYDCPRSIGLLTITGIDATGLLVSFTSTSEVKGTFHLLTHEWQFD